LHQNSEFGPYRSSDFNAMQLNALRLNASWFNCLRFISLWLNALL
jgi:hypothetical protein